MFLLEQILKSSQKHSQVIIVILLGIIAAGAVGGGLLIQNLNSILAEKEKLEGQRLALVEERYRTTLASRNLESKEVELAIRRTGESTRGFISRIRQIANDVEKVANDPGLPKEQKGQLLDLTKNLSVEIQLMSSEQEYLRTVWSANLQQSAPSPYSVPASGTMGASRFPNLIGFVRNHPASTAALILILIGTVFLVVRFSSGKRKALLHLDQARRILAQMVSFYPEAKEFAEYDARLRENNLEYALEELEELGEAHNAPPQFWKELMSAAESLGLKARIAKYRLRF